MTEIQQTVNNLRTLVRQNGALVKIIENEQHSDWKDLIVEVIKGQGGIFVNENPLWTEVIDSIKNLNNTWVEITDDEITHTLEQLKGTVWNTD